MLLAYQRIAFEVRENLKLVFLSSSSSGEQQAYLS